MVYDEFEQRVGLREPTVKELKKAKEQIKEWEQEGVFEMDLRAANGTIKNDKVIKLALQEFNS